MGWNPNHECIIEIFNYGTKTEIFFKCACTADVDVLDYM